MNSKLRVGLILFVLALPVVSTPRQTRAEDINGFLACVSTAVMFYDWCIASAATFDLLRVPLALACGEQLATDIDACDAAYSN